MARTVQVIEKFQRSGTTGDDPTYERGYGVWAEDAGAVVAMEIDEVIASIPVTIGDSFPEMAGVKCKEINSTASDDSEIWEVICSYKIPDDEDDIQDSFDDFMNSSRDTSSTNTNGPKFSGGSTIIEEYVTADLDGKLLANSAGVPFDPRSIPIPIDIDRVEVNERNRPNTSNKGKADGRKMLADISYSSETHVDKTTGVKTRYYKNTYVVWTHPYKNWVPTEVPDAGYSELVDDGLGGKELQPIKTKAGEPLNTIQPLNGNGRRLPEGGNPVYIKFALRFEGPLNVPFLT